MRVGHVSRRSEEEALHGNQMEGLFKSAKG